MRRRRNGKGDSLSRKGFPIQREDIFWIFKKIGSKSFFSREMLHLSFIFGILVSLEQQNGTRMNLYKSSVNSFDQNRRTKTCITLWKNIQRVSCTVYKYMYIHWCDVRDTRNGRKTAYITQRGGGGGGRKIFETHVDQTTFFFSLSLFPPC